MKIGFVVLPNRDLLNRNLIVSDKAFGIVTIDAEPSVTTFSSDHIKYHLHYSAEYRPARLKKLVSDGTILSNLTDLDRSVAETIERQVGMMLENDTEYLRAVAVGDLAKARGLENMD